VSVYIALFDHQEDEMLMISIKIMMKRTRYAGEAVTIGHHYTDSYIYIYIYIYIAVCQYVCVCVCVRRGANNERCARLIPDS